MVLALRDLALAVDELRLVVFRLAGESYALEVADVREVIFLPEVTAIPRQPSHVLGVINLRGRVLPVVDLRATLGLPRSERTSTTRVVVASQDDRLVGFLTDEVSQVATVGRDGIEPPAPTVVGAGGSHARGIVRIADSIVVWVDLARLLSAGETAREVAA